MSVIYAIRVLFFACLILCGSGNVSAEVIIDGAGRAVDVPQDPRRVIALAPNLTEMVYELGEGARLVGATSYSNHPEAAKKLPRIGSYVRLDLEKIVSLTPDLCLSSMDGNPRHAIDKIEEAGIPVFVVNPQGLAEIMQVVGQLGILLGAEKKAAELVADMGSRLEHVQSVIAAADSRPRVFFQIDETPKVSVGSETFIHELITRAGGLNLAAGDIAYPRYNWEDILSLDPDVVVITSMAGGRTPEQLQQSWQQWQQLSAVKNNRVYVVDANLFDRATPRLFAGLELLARIIHPQLFPDLKKNRE